MSETLKHVCQMTVKEFTEYLKTKFPATSGHIPLKDKLEYYGTLEKRVKELESELAAMTKERDELKQALEPMRIQAEHDGPEFREIFARARSHATYWVEYCSNLEEWNKRTEQERDKALAEKATLVEAMKEIQAKGHCGSSVARIIADEALQKVGALE